VNTQYAGISIVLHYFKIPNLIADSDLHTRKKWHNPVPVKGLWRGYLWHINQLNYESDLIKHLVSNKFEPQAEG
jgi:hypothetical protein